MADISKIQLSDNTQFNLKDATARNALSENDTSTGDISKIQLSDNTQYNIKDAQARQDIETVTTDVKAQVNADKDLINGGTAFIDDETLDDYDDKIAEMQEAYKKFIPLQTVSGTEIQLDNSNNDKVLVDIGLEGNTEQETTNGYNLVDTLETNIYITNSGLTYVRRSDGSIQINGTTNRAWDYTLTTTYEFVAGKTYTISMENSGTTSIVVYLLFNSTNGGQLSVTSSVPSNSRTIVENQTLAVRWSFPANASVNLDLKIMVEEGATKHNYEPYTGGIASPNPDYPQEVKVVTGENTITIKNSDNTQSQSYNINLGSLELAKISTYKDKIYNDDNDKKWYLRKEIGKVVLNGSESWGVGSSATSRSVFSLNTFTNKVEGQGNFYCDIFSYLGNAQTTDLGYAMSFNTGEYKNYCYAQVPTNVVTSQDNNAFKTWLSSHNATVYYPMITPTVTEITDENLISQLEAVKLLSGTQNNFTIDADTLPTLNFNYIGEANPHL